MVQRNKDDRFTKILLKGRGKENRMILITRFRLGSEMKKGRYWEGEKKRRYKICGWEKESWGHVVEMCMGEGIGGGKEEILEILEDDGRGECWMRVLSSRREREKKRGRTDEDSGRTGMSGECGRD